MSKHFKEQKFRDMAYYITLIKIEGHTSWRVGAMTGIAGGFDKEWKNTSGGTRPAITERITYRVDRITGEIKIHV